MRENDPEKGGMVSEHGSAISKRYQICCVLPAVRASHSPSTRSRCKSQEDSAMETSVVSLWTGHFCAARRSSCCCVTLKSSAARRRNPIEGGGQRAQPNAAWISRTYSRRNPRLGEPLAI